MGDDLGGRPVHDDQYDAEGHAIYSLMAEESGFRRAIDRLSARNSNSIASPSCVAAGNPAECHRRLLVGKVMAERGVELGARPTCRCRSC